MKTAAQRRAGRPAVELIETAVRALRTAPAGALLSYYVGSIPFLLGLLFYWADMSRGAFAHGRLIEASFSAAALYLWMKCWHTVFATKLRAHLTQQPEAPWTVRRVFRMALLQAAIQPVGLFVRPLAAQIILPYVWVYGFFQSAGVLGDGRHTSLGQVVGESGRQARLWLWQAHRALAAVLLFSIFVWINICVAFAMAPVVLKTFFGVETIFSRDLMAMLNSTTFAATLVATYLCIDPVRKAIVVLRCFHGASLRSGEDLHVELRSLTPPVRSAAAALLLAIVATGTCWSATARAEVPPSAPSSRVESAELNGALDRVLERREYAWRLPIPEEAADAQQGWFGSFLEEVWEGFARMFKGIRKSMDKFTQWLRHLLQDDEQAREPRDHSSINWTGTARWTLIILLGALLVVLAYLLVRWRQTRRPEAEIATSSGALPDLNEENVTADQLPEDGWLRLAREMMDRGDLRLALRAFYLAGLAHLGHRELIRIARHKSNHDYDRELRRRARGNADLISAFDANLLAFEASWYGDHTVTHETLGGFSQNLERIRAC